jgi:hypothetical protein
MTTKTMNLPKPREGSHLASYISYFSEEGLDLDRFVEAGGRLVGREDSAGLRSGLADNRGKISELRPAHPRLARQLELLAAFFAADAAREPQTVRTLPVAVCDETAFALLYTAKDVDLIPDDSRRSAMTTISPSWKRCSPGMLASLRGIALHTISNGTR